MKNYVLRSLLTLSGAAFFTLGMTGCPLPSSALQPWSDAGYPTLNTAFNTQHWLVLKCAFSDDPTARDLPTDLNPAIATLDEYIDFFMSLGGVGTGNIIDYYRDISYGAIDLQTRVYGWYNAPYPSNSTLNRVQRVEQCASAAPASDGIDFSSYDGIVIVTNKTQDGGAGYTGKGPLNINGTTYNMGAVVFDSGSLWTGFAGHEMGHGLGLPHSFDDSTADCGGGPGEYCDRFDMMSAMRTYQFVNANYPAEGAEAGRNTPGYGYGGAGPGMNAPNLLHFGAIPAARIATHLIGNSVETFTITALSKADGSLPLVIKIYNPDIPNDYFTVEYRQANGWDQGIASSVLIHEYKPNLSPFSYLVDGENASFGAWTTGGLYANRDKNVIVFVQSIDTTAGTATINVNSYGN